MKIITEAPKKMLPLPYKKGDWVLVRGNVIQVKSCGAKRIVTTYPHTSYTRGEGWARGTEFTHKEFISSLYEMRYLHVQNPPKEDLFDTLFALNKILQKCHRFVNFPQVAQDLLTTKASEKLTSALQTKPLEARDLSKFLLKRASLNWKIFTTSISIGEQNFIRRFFRRETSNYTLHRELALKGVSPEMKRNILKTLAVARTYAKDLALEILGLEPMKVITPTHRKEGKREFFLLGEEKGVKYILISLGEDFQGIEGFTPSNVEGSDLKSENNINFLRYVQ